MIRVRKPLRTVPCVVNGVRCRFHRFVDVDHVMVRMNAFASDEDLEQMRRKFKADLVLPDGSTDPKILRRVYALVEYPDGSLRRVDPEEVRFIRSEAK